MYWLRVKSQMGRGMFSAALFLIVTAALPQQAMAGFIGEYSVNLFTVTNVNGSGSAMTPDNGLTLLITGPNSGSGLDGFTDVTTFVGGSGLIRFRYLYSSLDLPGYDFAGYVLGTSFVPFADTDGQSATVLLSVNRGDKFGFRVGSLDNSGEPGVLAVFDFSAPVSAVPEPGTGLLFLVAGVAALQVGRLETRRRNKESKRSIVLGLAFAATFPLFGQTTRVVYSGAAAGQLTLLRSVNPQQPQQVSLKSQAVMQLRSFRQNRNIDEEIAPGLSQRVQPLRLPRSPFAASFSAVPTTFTATRPLSVVPGPVAVGFDGLTHLDQRLANGGNQFSVEPPNPSIAVGNGFVLEGVNNAIQVYTVSGTPLFPKALSTNELFGLPPAIDRSTGANGPFPTDMRVFFDAGINRWFVLQRAQDFDFIGTPLNSSRLFLAVSRTSDPTGIYNIYTMETTNSLNLGCPCVADYPQIGADQHGFYISVNEFNTVTQTFVDAVILAVSKTALAAGLSTPTVSRFILPFSSGYEFSIHPATTPPGASSFLANGGVQYFASTISSASDGSNVAVWAMSNTSSLATATPNLTLTRTIVPTLYYSNPNAATQPAGYRPYGLSLSPTGPLPLIDGGDSRVQSLFYAGGRLHLTFSTKALDESNRTVVGAAYVILSPTFRGGTVAASVVRQNTLVISNNHILRPAIGVDAQGQGAIAATVVGPNWYPSAAFIPVDSIAAPSSIRIAAAGTLPEDGFTGYSGGPSQKMARWGDYSTTAVASDGSVWMAVQYIGTLPRTAFANWGTFIMSTRP